MAQGSTGVSENMSLPPAGRLAAGTHVGSGVMTWARAQQPAQLLSKQQIQNGFLNLRPPHLGPSCSLTMSNRC